MSLPRYSQYSDFGFRGGAEYDRTDDVRTYGYLISLMKGHADAIESLTKTGFKIAFERDIDFRKIKSDFAQAQLQAQIDLYDIDTKNRVEAEKIISGLIRNVDDNLTRLSSTRSSWHRNVLEPARRAYRAGGAANREQAFSELVDTFKTSEGELKSVGNYQMYMALQTAFLDFGMTNAASLLTTAGGLGATAADKAALFKEIDKYVTASQTNKQLKDYVEDSLAYQKEHQTLMSMGADWKSRAEEIRQRLVSGEATEEEVKSIAQMLQSDEWANLQNSLYGPSVDADALALEVSKYQQDQTSLAWHKSEYERLGKQADLIIGQEGSSASMYLDELVALEQSGWLPSHGFDPRDVLVYEESEVEVKDAEGRVIRTETVSRPKPGPMAMLAIAAARSESLRREGRYGGAPFMLPGKQRSPRYYGTAKFEIGSMDPKDATVLKNSLRLPGYQDDKGQFAYIGSDPDTGTYITAQQVREIETAHLPSYYEIRPTAEIVRPVYEMLALDKNKWRVVTDGSQVFVMDPETNRGFFLNDQKIQNGTHFANAIIDYVDNDDKKSTEESKEVHGLYIYNNELGRLTRPVRSFDDIQNTPAGNSVRHAPKTYIYDKDKNFVFKNAQGEVVPFAKNKDENSTDYIARAQQAGLSPKTGRGPLVATTVNYTNTIPEGATISVQAGIFDVNSNDLSKLSIVLGDGNVVQIANGEGTEVTAHIEFDKVPTVLQSQVSNLLEDSRRSLPIGADGQIMSDEDLYTETQGNGLVISRPVETTRNIFRTVPRPTATDRLNSAVNTPAVKPPEIAVDVELTNAANEPAQLTTDPAEAVEKTIVQEDETGEPIAVPKDETTTASVELTENPRGANVGIELGEDEEYTQEGLDAWKQTTGTYKVTVTKSAEGGYVTVERTSADGTTETLSGEEARKVWDSYSKPLLSDEPSGEEDTKDFVTQENYTRIVSGLFPEQTEATPEAPGPDADEPADPGETTPEETAPEDPGFSTRLDDLKEEVSQLEEGDKPSVEMFEKAYQLFSDVRAEVGEVASEDRDSLKEDFVGAHDFVRSLLNLLPNAQKAFEQLPNMESTGEENWSVLTTGRTTEEQQRKKKREDLLGRIRNFQGFLSGKEKATGKSAVRDDAEALDTLDKIDFEDFTDAEDKYKANKLVNEMLKNPDSPFDPGIEFEGDPRYTELSDEAKMYTQQLWEENHPEGKKAAEKSYASVSGDPEDPLEYRFRYPSTDSSEIFVQSRPKGGGAGVNWSEVTDSKEKERVERLFEKQQAQPEIEQGGESDPPKDSPTGALNFEPPVEAQSRRKKPPGPFMRAFQKRKDKKALLET
jgi:hypothetical protein